MTSKQRFIYPSVYSHGMKSKDMRHFELIHSSFDCKSDLSKKEGELNDS